MTVGRVRLFPGGHAPDGTGTGNDAASLIFEVSSAQATNCPKVARYVLVFDPTTDQHWMFQDTLPGDYSSGGTLRGLIACPSVSPGNVIMKAGISFGDGNRTDDDFEAADLSAAIAMSAIANELVEFTIALTMTGGSANEGFVIFIGRDADNILDTASSSNLHLTNLIFEYTQV